MSRLFFFPICLARPEIGSIYALPIDTGDCNAISRSMSQLLHLLYDAITRARDSTPNKVNQHTNLFNRQILFFFCRRFEQYTHDVLHVFLWWNSYRFAIFNAIFNAHFDLFSLFLSRKRLSSRLWFISLISFGVIKKNDLMKQSSDEVANNLFWFEGK